MTCSRVAKNLLISPVSWTTPGTGLLIFGIHCRLFDTHGFRQIFSGDSQIFLKQETFILRKIQCDWLHTAVNIFFVF